MLYALMWGFLVLSFAVGVVPIASMLMRDARHLPAAVLLSLFGLLVSASAPASAAWPVGYTNAAASSTGPAGSGATVTCEPGTATRYVIGWAGFDDAGTCPAGGTFTCDQAIYFNFAAYSGGYCYVEAAGSGGGDGGGTTTSVSLKPFDMPAEDGALISAAILSVWGAGWGVRAVIDTLRDRKDGD